MGVAERREREKKQRRNDIINAAEKLFFSKGFTNTSMDEVANEAELSKGTLYLYFKSKEDLYLGINVRGLTILEEMFKDAIEQGANGLDKTRKIGEAYFDFSRKYPDYFNIMIYYLSNDIALDETESSAIACEHQGQKTLQAVADAIKIGIDDGSIREDVDPMTTANVLWAHSTGVITTVSLRGDHLIEKHKMDVQKIIDLSFDMTGRALKK